MSKRLRVQLETYAEATGLLTAANALGNSNRTLLELILEDINSLISYGIYNSSTLEPSVAVEWLVDNVSRNQEICDNDRINDINYAAGLLATDILAACMLIDDFYAAQIDVDGMKFYELPGPSASIRMEMDRAYDMDDDRSPDAPRLVSGFFMLYRCSGEQSKELRNEIRCTVSGYIGTASRSD